MSSGIINFIFIFNAVISAFVIYAHISCQFLKLAVMTSYT